VWVEHAVTTRTSFIKAQETTANVGINVSISGGTFIPAETLTQLVLELPLAPHAGLLTD
jgi:hypothetical protein